MSASIPVLGQKSQICQPKCLKPCLDPAHKAQGQLSLFQQRGCFSLQILAISPPEVFSEAKFHLWRGKVEFSRRGITPCSFLATKFRFWSFGTSGRYFPLLLPSPGSAQRFHSSLQPRFKSILNALKALPCPLQLSVL